MLKLFSSFPHYIGALYRLHHANWLPRLGRDQALGEGRKSGQNQQLQESDVNLYASCVYWYE